jgi:hypothetical protein
MDIFECKRGRPPLVTILAAPDFRAPDPRDHADWQAVMTREIAVYDHFIERIGGTSTYRELRTLARLSHRDRWRLDLIIEGLAKRIHAADVVLLPAGPRGARYLVRLWTLPPVPAGFEKKDRYGDRIYWHADGFWMEETSARGEQPLWFTNLRELQRDGLLAASPLTPEDAPDSLTDLLPRDAAALDRFWQIVAEIQARYGEEARARFHYPRLADLIWQTLTRPTRPGPPA